MPKLTDEQIIEAVNYCKDVDTDDKCVKCPVKHICDNDNDSLMAEIADLINRLKADNEKLREENKDIVIIRDANSGKIVEKGKIKYLSVEEIKAEAYKEFAERLKALYTRNKTYDRPNPHTSLDYLFANIDKILKEMAGEG